MKKIETIWLVFVPGYFPLDAYGGKTCSWFDTRKDARKYTKKLKRDGYQVYPIYKSILIK